MPRKKDLVIKRDEAFKRLELLMSNEPATPLKAKRKNKKIILALQVIKNLEIEFRKFKLK